MFIIGERGSKCSIKAGTMRIMTLEGVLNVLRAARHTRIKSYFDSNRADLRTKAQNESTLTFEQYYLQDKYTISYLLPNVYYSIPDNLIPPRNSKNRKVNIGFILQQAQQQNILLTDRFLDYPVQYDFNATLEIDEDDLEDIQDMENES